MSPEKQRIAIAETCGWHVPAIEITQEHPYGVLDSSTRPLPDYLTDLNAMHEAEKVLTKEQKQQTAWNLVQILDNWSVWEPDEYDTVGCWEMSLYDIIDCLSATAAQRAEAFLRTLNKWEDDK